jgi:SSS family transporter
MHIIDWLVLLSTIVFIIGYGMWKTRKTDTIESYLMGDRDLKWWTIGLSIMATQASGITFLSTPGQAYGEGMRFVQFYFGLPIAMVILSIFVLPIYYRLKVYTAYEYLEGRFDLRMRTLTACLFLLQRGMAAGLTIYAPSIILSTILGWNLMLTNLAMGVVVIAYTVVGGTKAVSETQQQQMAIILTGLFVALAVVIYKMPPKVSFTDAVDVAGKLGKMNIVNFNFNIKDRYNFWSGILGGTFLFLAYFGTDQSQVQRYLSGKTLTESRLGLLFNAMLKIPMQFTVLFTGIMVFMFYQFTLSPVHFNPDNVEALQNSEYSAQYKQLEVDHEKIFEDKKNAIYELIKTNKTGDQAATSLATEQVQNLIAKDEKVRDEVKTLIQKQDGTAEKKDDDYIFINFVLHHLPIGVIGLLVAVIFAAAMSSISAELNALATTTIIDIYRRSLAPAKTDDHYLNASKFFTILWGVLALGFATVASLFDNLIEAVNIIGSLFYGVILGIFAVAFFFKRIGGTAVFYSALFAEVIILLLFVLDKYDKFKLVYLWYNPIGCFLVIVFATLLSLFLPKQEKTITFRG